MAANLNPRNGNPMELEQPGAENQSATVPVSIEGRFELFDCIGRGGMGTVYRGLQLPLGTVRDR